MEKISEKQAKEMYKEQLDDLKEEWIKNYYGGDVLEEIDTIAFNVGFNEYCSEHLPEQGYELEEN